MSRSLNGWKRAARRLLRPSSRRDLSTAQVLTVHRRHFDQTFVLVRIFYALQLMFLGSAFKKWHAWADLGHLDGLWPLSWGAHLPASLVAGEVLLLFAVSVFCAVLWPQRRLARILLFVGLFQYVALDNSFGKIDHGHHAWLYVSFVLIFLPDGPAESLRHSITRRQTYLMVWAGAQAVVLMLYSLAGWWKLFYGIRQAMHGQMGVFSPSGFAYMTASRLLQTDSHSVLGPLIIELGPWGGFILWSGIYIELFALLIVFRPSLLRFWGLALVSLHMGTELVLTIGFGLNVILIAVLLIASPVPEVHWRGRLRDLPLFGRPLTWILDRGSGHRLPRPS